MDADERTITDALADLDWAAYVAASRTTDDSTRMFELITSIGTFLVQRTKSDLLAGALKMAR